MDTHLLESAARKGTGSTTCSGPTLPNGPRATYSAAERDAAVTRLLAWCMRAADAAVMAVAPRRYNVPSTRRNR